MQKGAFVTLTYLEINPALKQVAMIRAGHCPGYFYCAANQSLRSLREGTLGLGILRSGNYRSMMPAPTLVSYRPGDVLVLFTDGIVEARDEAANEFGYERIEAMIRDHARGSAGEIADAIVNSAKLFTRSKLQDDYTVLVIRFT
jgi:serine phosphatase RsbU (regulator of sigma subunit)